MSASSSTKMIDRIRRLRLRARATRQGHESPVGWREREAASGEFRRDTNYRSVFSPTLGSQHGVHLMAQLKRVVEPFGEVNVHPASGGKVKVIATILMEPRREGTQTGIALDGSGSMSSLYGIEEAGSGGFFASLFGRKKPTTARNEI